MPDATIIGYNHLLAGATADPVGAAVALIPSTAESYTDGTATVTFTAAANFTADYIAVGAHNFGTTGKTITIQYSTTTGGSFVNVFSGIPTSDNAIMQTFASLSIRRVRIVIAGGSGNFRLGVVYSGAYITMEQSIYGGHSPLTLSAQTDYQNNETDTGNWLSRSIVKRGLAGSFEFRHITASWYRSTFHPFVKSARTLPFFIKWRPTGYPLEAALCWTTGDIIPRNMGVRDFMEVTVPVRGYGDVQ